MGINIQQYRASIGSFIVFGSFSRKVSRQVLSKPLVQKPTKLYLAMSIIAFLFSLLAGSYSVSNPRRTILSSENMNYIHPWRPGFSVVTALTQSFLPGLTCGYKTVHTSANMKYIHPWRPSFSVVTTPAQPFLPRLTCSCSIIHTTEYVKNIHSWRPFYPVVTAQTQPFLPRLEFVCPYSFRMITNFQSKYVNGNKSSRGIKIAHWNKGSSHLINKMAEIRNLIDKHQPHILGVSEANLLDYHDQSLVTIPDYNLHVCPTITNHAMRNSRVVVYTHKNIVAKLRPDLMCDSYSSIWLEIGLPHHRKFLVNQSYREWQQMGNRSSNSVPDQLARWLIFLDQWERALATGREVHCTGDMNLNHCNWVDPQLPRSNQSYKLRELTAALFSRIVPHGVSQLVTGPTRHFPGQVSTGLDHYYTNRPDKISTVQTHHSGSSDHMLIFAVRQSKTIRSTPRYIRKRSFKHFNPEIFVKAVQEISWLDVYLSSDVDEAVEIFTRKITEILDEMAPMKSIQIRSNYSPWLCKDTLDLMKARDEVQKLASETRSRDDWVKYKQLRNRVTNRLRYQESSWQRRRLSECGVNSSKTWKCVKGILNWNSSGSPTQLFYKGSLKTKSQDIADSQNQYFIDKVEQIRKELPPAVSDPLLKLRQLMSARKCEFTLQPVHPDQVLAIINNLSNSNAFGLDQVDTSTLKLVKTEILPAVTHIMNLSIISRKFPTSWKKSKVIPLHKKGDLLDPKNYRPVAIVPILSKILEKVIFLQMIGYLNENNLLHPNHHAYRAHHNTTTALIQMYDTWLEAAEAGTMAGVCLLDMSAAFDVVDHGLLIKKLALYGFQEDFLRWTESYLSSRFQCVSIEGSLSRLQAVQVGVPQGSILGPLFYTLFTNELPEVIHDNSLQPDQFPPYQISAPACCSICCYADDTTLTATESDHAALTDKLSAKYEIVSDFMLNNRLKLNDDKTHLLVFSTSQARIRTQSCDLVQIKTPSEMIKQSFSEKLLGCWVQNDFKWSDYIRDNSESLVRALTIRLAAVTKISKVASFKDRRMIADGIFTSKLTYLISVWGGCGAGMMRTLQIIQNKMARTVARVDWKTPTKEVFHQCGWLSVNQLAMYHSVLLVYKVKANKQPRYLSNMYMGTYKYNTKLAQSGQIKMEGRPKLEVTHCSFKWRAAKKFNQLPLELRNSGTLEIFKHKVKAWIRENIKF